MHKIHQGYSGDQTKSSSVTSTIFSTGVPRCQIRLRPRDQISHRYPAGPSGSCCLWLWIWEHRADSLGLRTASSTRTVGCPASLWSIRNVPSYPGFWQKMSVTGRWNYFVILRAWTKECYFMNSWALHFVMIYSLFLQHSKGPLCILC